MVESSEALVLSGFIGANFLAASSGAIFKPGTWYERLQKPAWTPPNWAFPVVWSILFLMNAVAGWLVWLAEPENAFLIFTVYGGSLVVNALWSCLFFGLKRMDWAFADVAALALSIVAVMALFAPVNALAAALLAPYLAWVSLAAVLNYRMVRLNPRQAQAIARDQPVQ